MPRKQKGIRTDIGCGETASIALFGNFTSEMLGHLNLGDMGFPQPFT